MAIFKLPPPPVGETMPSPAWSDWFYKLQQFILSSTGSNTNYYDLQNRPPIPYMLEESSSSDGEVGPPGPPGPQGIPGSGGGSVGPSIYAFAAAHG